MYSGNHSLGWHFYCDRTDEKEDGEPESAVNQTPESAPEIPHPPEDDAIGKIRELRRQLEQKRSAAILDPTTENVTAYLHLQQETLEKAAVFSEVFRRTVWSTPELDYTLRRPVGALAKRLWSDGRRAERDGVLARLGERYGLIYLGDADCEGCRVFGPLLRAFPCVTGWTSLPCRWTASPWRAGPRRCRTTAAPNASAWAVSPCPPWFCSTPEQTRPSRWDSASSPKTSSPNGFF